MGPTIREDEYAKPLSLEGKLPRENVPLELRSDEHLSETTDSLHKRDALTGTADNKINEAQALANLQEKANSGDKDAKFELGQFYFEHRKYEEARFLFEEIESEDMQAKYQLAVMYYDGLGVEANHEKAVKIMEEVTNNNDKKWHHLVPFAQYQLGRAFYEGFGVKQSDAEAERLWTLAARDGDPNGSVKAQSTLAMFYSRPGEDTYDLQKAHFWHQEATGNGSHESQAALGILYLHGLGVKKDTKSSFLCLKGAAERGNIYAIGQLTLLYYKLKLFNNAVDFAQRIVCIPDADRVAERTGCLVHYIRKGIALSCYVYGRCLYKGYGIKENKDEALRYYSKAAEFDLEIANQLQESMIQGYI